MITTKEVVIENGLDKGKKFSVSTMPLMKGDKWGNRVIHEVCKAGVKLPEALNNGFNGLLDIVPVIEMAVKALGGINTEAAEELLTELMGVVKIVLPDGSTRTPILESDITDVDSLWILRMEAIRVNHRFLTKGVTL